MYSHQELWELPVLPVFPTPVPQVENPLEMGDQFVPFVCAAPVRKKRCSRLATPVMEREDGAEPPAFSPLASTDALLMMAPALTVKYAQTPAMMPVEKLADSVTVPPVASVLVALV